jgi:hypothetical protein
VSEIILSDEQLALTRLSLHGITFLDGPPGTGKTTASVNRLLSLLNSGIRAEEILILVPQRTLAQPYLNALRDPNLPPGGQTSFLTMGGLAQRTIQLFWPLIAETAGFSRPDLPPVFLTLETTQYYLARLVEPLKEQGYFQSISINPNRLLSQIIDNLNKAAAVGFDPSTIGDRLIRASLSKPEELHAYVDAQDCAIRFRKFCLDHNLLDFSLQLEIFHRILWPSQACQNYLYNQYRHLVYDNIEEDVPVAHDIIRSWLPSFESALLIYDTGGGYRVFLGADPASGVTLEIGCDHHFTFNHSWTVTENLISFGNALQSAIHHEPIRSTQGISQAATTFYHRFATQSMDAVTEHINQLIHEDGISPSEIVVLSPFMSDSLRFALMDRLNKLDIPNHSHRPSRTLRDEPAVQTLLTLSKLAHPYWNIPCSHQEIRSMLTQSITGLDSLRADLLARIAFRPTHWKDGFGSFDAIRPEAQNRITYSAGERFERIRQWLIEYQSDSAQELDIFLSRLFGELLSQPGFGFHISLEQASVANRLIESARKFRWVIASSLENGQNSENDPNRPSLLGQEYIMMVNSGILAAQYLQSWEVPPTNSVLLAPAYTFLMMNYPVRYQFWMDIGGLGWYERLSQPLTHPYVLSRHWPSDRIWTDADEHQTSQENLIRLTLGLLNRCQEHIFLYINGMNEQGDEQRGPLLYALQAILRQKQENPDV